MGNFITNYLFGGVSWTLVAIVFIVALLLNAGSWAKKKITKKDD